MTARRDRAAVRPPSETAADAGDGTRVADALAGGVVPLGTLVPDPANRRVHPERNVAMITQSLREVGPGRSIVVDERGEIIAGNGVVQSAPAAGITRVRIVDAQRDELIAVRRTDLTDEQKRAMAIFDNRTAELAEWDAERLQLDDAAGLALAPYFSDAELVELEVRKPGFTPTPEDEQGRLDIKRQITCPHCGASFEV